MAMFQNECWRSNHFNLTFQFVKTVKFLMRLFINLHFFSLIVGRACQTDRSLQSL